MLGDLVGNYCWFVVFAEILVLVFLGGEGIFVCTKVYGFAQLYTGVFPMFWVGFYGGGSGSRNRWCFWEYWV